MQTAPDSDTNAERAAVGPDRRCAITRQVRPREALVRFVVDPSGTLVPDVAGRLPGRGLWIAAERDTLAAACRRGALARAARQAVTVPDDLPERVEVALRRRALDTLGLARRAGQAVAGYEKTRAWLVAGRAAVVLLAADAADNARRKLAGAAAGVPMIETFTAAELGGAMGRDHAVHGALAGGGLADRLALEAGRLARVRGEAPASGLGEGKVE